MAHQVPISYDYSPTAIDTAAAVLRSRFEAMAEHFPAAMQPANGAAVHDMRVASRRLRAALRDLLPLFGADTPNGLDRSVKRITRTLGAVRDHDVAIIALSSDPSNYPLLLLPHFSPGEIFFKNLLIHPEVSFRRSSDGAQREYYDGLR